MSRLRCNHCKYIVDNGINQTDNCPNCGLFDPDDEWPNLSDSECALFWEVQLLKQTIELLTLQIEKLNEKQYDNRV